MKRIELLKRTGICFTAVALSTMIGMANPTLVPVITGGQIVEASEPEEDQESEPEQDPQPEPQPDPQPEPQQDPQPDPQQDPQQDPQPEPVNDDPGSGDSSGSSSSSSGSSSSGTTNTSGNSGSDNTTDNSGTGGNSTSAVSVPESQSGSTGQNTADPAAPASTNTPSTGPTSAAPGAATTGAAAAGSSSTSAKAKDTASEAKKKAVTLDPDETPGSYNQTLMYNGTNTQLIANQNIVSGLSIIRNDFRFVTVDKEPAIAADRHGVYEEMDELSREIGMLSKGDVVYILSEEEDGWLYIESGNVRGFIKKKNVKPADSIPGDEIISFAEEKIPASENDAYAYKHCTTKSTVIDKDYAVADVDTAILEGTEGDSREVGHLATGSLCYVIMQADQKWAYVESGNVRGFAPVKNLTTGSKAKDIVKEKGEESMTKAEELISPSDNKAVYYTLNSVHDGVEYNSIRSDLVETAAKCIGNPYVWGGTSLTNGADCSGFVQTLYSLFGYHIPRVADAQSQYGTQIPISDAAPGDLIFFASNGYVYHVAMYAGDGMTIEAYSDDRGIIATSIGNRDAVWATRVIED